jgi:preprotein translocase subunit YajC
MEDLTFRQVLPYLLLAGFALAYWWLVLRPQSVAYHKQRELIRTLEVGDRIVTAGGLHGVIRELNDDTYLLETDDGLKLRFDRKAVNRRVEETT